MFYIQVFRLLVLCYIKIVFLPKVKLGLWIDLTNTSRFYDEEEVNRQECKYVKLNCKGHGETPSEASKNLFVNLVEKFISTHPLQRIAVHCTHGFNRTGFMIISYLTEKMDFSLEVAMEMFSKARCVSTIESIVIKRILNNCPVIILIDNLIKTLDIKLILGLQEFIKGIILWNFTEDTMT